MNKSEIAEKAAREIRETLVANPDMHDIMEFWEQTIAKVVERAIAESQAPQPNQHEWTGSQWDDQMYCECGAVKLEDGSIKCVGDGEPSPPPCAHERLDAGSSGQTYVLASAENKGVETKAMSTVCNCHGIPYPDCPNKLTDPREIRKQQDRDFSREEFKRVPEGVVAPLEPLETCLKRISDFVAGYCVVPGNPSKHESADVHNFAIGLACGQILDEQDNQELVKALEAYAAAVSKNLQEKVDWISLNNKALSAANKILKGSNFGGREGTRERKTNAERINTRRYQRNGL